MNQSGKIIKKVFWKSLLVMVFSSLTATVGMVVDGIVTGKYLGVDAIAAYGLSMPAFIAITAFGGIISSGVQTLCAGKMAQGKMDEANDVFSYTCIASIVMSIFVGIGLFIFSEEIARFLGASGTLIDETAAYLRGLSFGAPAIILTFCFHPIMQLDSDRGRIFLSVIVMTVVNILGDFAVVFILKNGMFGMALATSVSYIVSVLVLLLHFKKKEAMYHFEWKKVNFKVLYEVFVIGLPTALARVCNSAKVLVLNNMLFAVGGTVAVAALSLQSNVNNLIGIFAVGVGSTVLLVSGVVIGEKDKTSSIALMKTAYVEGFVFVSIVSLILYLVAPMVVNFYLNGEEEVITVATFAVKCLAISMPFHLIGQVFVNFLQGKRDMLRANLVTFLNEFGFIIGLSAILMPMFGETGIWYALPLSKFMAIPLIFVMASLHLKRLPRNFEDLLFLSKDFDEYENSKLEASASKMEHVVEMSEQARAFCLRHGVEAKRAFYVALCIEEMAGNIISYGFNDGKKHDIDLRLFVTEDEVVIRIRDDCRSFNPKQWLSIHAPEDPYANIGIRMVNSFAKSFEYINTLSTNNLIIKL